VTSRFIIKAGIVLTLACLSAPIAAASGWAPPGQAGSFDGRSPDTKDAALAAHRGSRVLSASKVVTSWPPVNGNGYDGRSPDTKDAALAAHRGGRVLSASKVVTLWPPLNATGYDGRSPDTKDAALAAQRNGSPKYDVAIGYASPPLNATACLIARPGGACYTGSKSHPAGTFDGRSQDTKDAALAAHNPAATVVIASAGGFDWTDAGIGAAAGFGLAVMLAVGLTLTRKESTVAAS
jgi:hypothetical protein